MKQIYHTISINESIESLSCDEQFKLTEWLIDSVLSKKDVDKLLTKELNVIQSLPTNENIFDLIQSCETIKKHLNNEKET